MKLNYNYWRVDNMIRSAGSFEVLEQRMNNLGLKMRDKNGVQFSNEKIIDTIQGYFDRIYPHAPVN